MKTIDTSCLVCGVPIITGRVDRTVHFSCRRERSRQTSNSWYHKHRDKLLPKRAEQARHFRENNLEKRMLRGAADRARYFDLPFDLELSDIVIPAMCPILNVPLEFKTRYAPSLDRISPEKGYVKENVQVVSKKANAMKQDATERELKEFAKWVNRTFPH
jgi:hypothetical protein